MTTLGERLRAAMDAANISQAELARACGVKPPSVHGWLSGKSRFLRGENLLRAALVLGVDHDWLATGRGEMLRLKRVQADRLDFAMALDPLAKTASEQRLLAAHRLGPDGAAALDALADQLLRRASGGRAAGNES